MENKFKEIRCKYKGIIPLSVYKQLLLETLFKDTFCASNMEHKKEVSKLLDEYLKQYKKLQKAFKQCHTKK